MIDINAIETDLSARVSTTGFTSVEISRIREVVPITLMPSLDIAATGFTTQQDANRSYTVPVLMVIRRQGVDRGDNSAAFKAYVKQIAESLEGFRSDNIDAVRDISADFGESTTGDGHFVRSAIMECKILSH